MTNMKNPRYAGFWIRLLACILDAIIIGIPALILNLIFIFIIGIEPFQYLVQLAVTIFIIYMDGIHGGTPGKLIVGVRIVNEQGEYIGIPTAILRYIGKILSGIILGIGYLMIAWDPKKQGLHDKIAETYVIYKR